MFAVVKKIESGPFGEETEVACLVRLTPQSLVGEGVDVLDALADMRGYKMLDGSNPPSRAERLLEDAGVASDTPNATKAFRRLLDRYDLSASYPQRADAIKSAVEKLGAEATTTALLDLATRIIAPSEPQK